MVCRLYAYQTNLLYDFLRGDKLSAKKITELSLLTALALIIFVVELRIPNICPVPGVKLGLANIITVYAVYHFKASETAMLVFSRVILGSFFSGNVSALLYSISGAVFCLIGMLCIKKIIPEKYICLCSIAGAIFHNIGQICAAIVIMNTFTVIVYLPILIFFGCIAGFFTGMCASLIIRRLADKKLNSYI